MPHDHGWHRRAWDGEADPAAQRAAAAHWLDVLPPSHAADVLAAAGLLAARADDIAAVSGRWALLPEEARTGLIG